MTQMVSFLASLPGGIGRPRKLPRTGDGKSQPPELPALQCRSKQGASARGTVFGRWTAKCATPISTSSTSPRNSCAGGGAIETSMRGSRPWCEMTPAGPYARRWPCPGAWAFPVDPDAAAGTSPAIWSASAAPAVIVMDRAPDGFEGIDLALLLAGREVVADRSDQDGRHLVFAARAGRHRLLVKNPASRRGHAFVIIPDGQREARLAALASLHWTQSARSAAADIRGYGPSPYQRHRLNLMLTILDSLGRDLDRAITIRELAETSLFPGAMFGRSIEWKTSSWRRQTQRLVREALDMTNGGYRKLLSASPRSAKCDVR